MTTGAERANWERLHALWEAGTPCGLATVVSTFGSAPRRPGAIMLATPDGKVTGSVSGGCVDGAVYDLCHQAIKDGIPVPNATASATTMPEWAA